MKPICTLVRSRILLLFMLSSLAFINTTLSQICSDANNTIYGLTSTGIIRPIKTNTANVQGAVNPPYTGNAPNYSNAIGYNNQNGRFYYFKRNTFAAPQEFVSFDPATNTVTILSSCPLGTSTIVNLGCVLANGTGYYCIDAYGTLLYYNIPTNTWTLITSNLVDQYGTNLTPIFNARIYGDMATDGLGNLWIMPANATQYGLYKLSAPLPTVPKPSVTVERVKPPTTPTPNGNTIGGIAFSPSGNIFVSTNSPDNKLFRLNPDYTFTLIGAFNVDGVGNDLASCIFPLSVLTVSWENFKVELKKTNDVVLSWTVREETDNKGYHIEHSLSGNEWKTIGFVKSDAANNGKYSYADNSRLNGKHHYRIRSETNNGYSNYSIAKNIEIKNGRPVVIGPNPANNILQISLEPWQSNHGNKMILFDKTGRIVMADNLRPGLNSLNIRELFVGSYVVKVQLSDGQVYTHKIIKK